MPVQTAAELNGESKAKQGFGIQCEYYEYLKNHSKSQNIYKMENWFFLDFTRVVLYIEHIVWYNLVKIIF